MRRVIDNTGPVEITYHRSVGETILNYCQDVEPILDFNKAAGERLDKKRDWWFVGTIPDVVVMQWAKESNTKPYTRAWRQYAKKQLRKAEYRKLNPNRIMM